MEGTQHNLIFIGDDAPWLDIAMAILKLDSIPEGYKNPDERHFHLLPKQNDQVQKGVLVKYRGTKVLSNLAL